MFETIKVDVEDRIGHLTLANPEKLNPLSLLALNEIADAAAWFDRRPEVRVVVVGGAGRAFTGGADLELFTGGIAENADPRSAADAGARMADSIERMRPVAIAAIHGHCVGGGVVLAAACDLRIATAGTVFMIPEIDLGIPLGWGGIPRLVREIGPALTKELVMTGRPFSAEEAAQIGFVNRVVPAGEVRAVADDLAATLALKTKNALFAAKRHTNAVTAQMVGLDRSFADADSLLVGLSDPEGREAASRYLTGGASPDE